VSPLHILVGGVTGCGAYLAGKDESVEVSCAECKASVKEEREG